MSRVLACLLVLVCAYARPAWAQTGTVSGTVTRAASATPAADVTLALCTASYSCTYGSTDASGGYTVSAEPGTYYLWTENELGLIDEIYDNVQCPGACDLWLAVPSGSPITLTAGATLSGRNFALDQGGALSGTIVNSGTSAPVSSIFVYAYSFEGNSSRFAGYGLTNAAGAYTISGLPTGTYFLHTYNNLGFINEMFDNVPCTGGACSTSTLLVQGVPVAVQVGTTAANRNFALEMGGTISGIVRSSATLAPLENVSVSIRVLGVNGGTSSAAFATTNASGVYSARGLPTGTYYAYTSNSGAYIPEVYDNIQCTVSCSDVTGGTPILVTAGATTTGKNFDLDVGGSISGVVTRADTSSPIEGVSVWAYELTADGSPRYAGSGSTDASGAFSVQRLFTGTYYLYTTNSAGFVNEIFDNVGCVGECQIYTFAARATGIAVTVGATSAGKNFALEVGGRFSGTVSTSGGTPIKDAYVYAMTRDAAGVYTYATSASTNASGSYEVMGLPTGTYYAYTDRVGYQNEIYNDVRCIGGCVAATAASAGDAIAVVAGESHPGINFVLDTGGSISGTVRGAATSAGLGSVYVYAYRKGGDGYADYAGYGATNAFGAYTISGLPTGEYYVLTSLSGYQNQVFPAVNCVRFCSSEFAQSFGTPVAVANGATTSGHDFALNEATGRVAGTITNSATMGPAPGVYVYFYARINGSEVYVGYGYSNASGGYELTGVPPGTYFAVTNSYGPFVDEIHPDIPCFTACDYGTGAIAVGSPIVVGAGTVTVNFALQPRPAEQTPGQVQNLSARIANARVVFTWSAPYEFGMATDYLLDIGLSPGATLVSIPVAARTYTAEGVPAGRYFARVRGRNAAGFGPPADEYEFTVNPDGSGAPDAPSNLQVLLEGGQLTASWSSPAAGGHVTGYVLEIGSATGLSDIAAVPIGPRSIFSYTGQVPPGVYFLRVRARNAMSVGRPSVEVMLVAGRVPAPLDPPGNIGFSVDATRAVTIGWLPPRGAVLGYRLEVGSATRRSDIGVISVAASATSITAPGVSPGTYYVRLRSINAQGASVASYETTVIVP